MISSYEIQAAYNDLYVCFRNYIWGLPIIEMLADLEIASYQAFPDISEVRRCLNKLSSSIRQVMNKDDELKSAVENFQELVSCDDLYLKLNKVREVVVV